MGSINKHIEVQVELATIVPQAFGLLGGGEEDDDNKTTTPEATADDEYPIAQADDIDALEQFLSGMF